MAPSKEARIQLGLKQRTVRVQNIYCITESELEALERCISPEARKIALRIREDSIFEETTDEQ